MKYAIGTLGLLLALGTVENPNDLSIYVQAIGVLMVFALPKEIEV